MRVSVVRSELVQVQESLVYVLLQGQRTLHGFLSAPPLITLGFLSATWSSQCMTTWWQ